MKANKSEGKQEFEKLFRNMELKTLVEEGNGVPKIWVVRLENEKQSRGEMKMKSELKGRGERLEEDRTWKEIRESW